MCDETFLRALRDKADRMRIHCIRSTTEAGSGHPTSCLSAADVVAALFFRVMRYDPNDPGHPNNDRFILSKGHAAPLLYAAYAEAGAIPVEKLMTLRKFDSELEGHPTPRFPWAEVATGSLGQGLSIGFGMALNGKLDRLDYRVYVLLGDGESAEGSVWEAAALAAHYGLDNLVGILDMNGLGQSQRTMYEFDDESYRRRFGAFGWHAIVIDGHDYAQILTAFEEAAAMKDRPTMIIARTLKGKGISFLEDKEGWHGKPLPAPYAERAIEELEPASPARASFTIRKPAPAHAPGAASFGSVRAPEYAPGDTVATREAYGTVLAKLGDVNPLIVSLDGDTKNSTFAQTFMHAHPDRYFEGFIAEQNMVGAAVGFAARGKIPFVSTFGAFMTRAFDHIRMSGISRANVKYVGSHCGVSIGQDGPSQMALEDLAMMRAVPRSIVLYPCDAVSAERLTEAAASHRGIVYLRTSRPKTPVIYANDESFPVGGSKVLRADGADRIALVAAGVTVHEALKAYDRLRDAGISVRVIDAYSIKPVDRNALLRAARETGGVLLTVEDHYPEGGLGDAVLSAVGEEGVRVYKMAVNDIPRSGAPEELLDTYGIGARRIVDRVQGLLG